MLRRRRGDRDALQVEVLPPIELGNSLRRDPPTFEPLADTERRYERHVAACFRQREDCGAIEMVVVVVRHYDGVELWQRSERSGWRMETLWTRERQRRRAIGPDRIGEDANSVDL